MAAHPCHFVVLAFTALFALGCGRTGTICVTATDCQRGQVCSADGCVDLPDGGLGGGAGGGMGGGLGGGIGGGLGGGIGGGMGGGLGGGMGGGTGGGSTCGPRETQCPSGCKDLSLDLDNCGRCGRPCPEAQNATATCSAGLCGLRCAVGFADCDLNPLNGCEANFADPATCGSCQNRCAAGPHSTATCGMGVCGLACNPGFGNCDFFAANGCEADLSSPANCGVCGNLCRTAPNQVASCFMDVCGTQCRAGFADCDLLPTTGCEASLSSPMTCGSCSNACPSGGAHTTATCAGSTCGSQCQPGFADCDGLAANGCEADLGSSATCGSCAVACPPGQACGGGACGSMCPAPAVGVLAVNSTVTGTLLPGPGRFPAPTCSTQSTRYEDLWTLTLTTPTTVVLQTGGSLDTVLMLRSSCTATVDLGCNDDTPGLNLLSRITILLQPGTYAVLVKQWGANAMGGAYSLSASVATSNSLCSTPTQLLPGVPVPNQSSASGGATSNFCVPAAGGQLFYSLDVPPNSRASITTTPTSPFSVTARLLSACGATSCLGSAQGTGAQQLSFDNPTTATRSVIVSVAATQAGTSGTFEIAAVISSNASCSGATPLIVDGLGVSGEVIDTGGAPLTAACLPGQTGRVRYYSVQVPARGAVTVSATPTGFDLGLRVLSSCSATTCLAFADATPAFVGEGLRITNPDPFARNFFVAVSSTFSGTGGTFFINAVTATPPPASNAFCDTPAPLTPGVALASELSTVGGLPLLGVCLPSQSGYTRYYSVAVPAGSTLQATVTPAGFSGLDVGVRVLTGCAATSCLAAGDASPSLNAAEAVVVSNTTGAPQLWLIAAGGTNTSPVVLSAFRLLATVSPTAADGTCAGATPIAVGQTLLGETLAGAGAPSLACLPAVTGLTKYYRVDLAAGERVAITALPANFDVSLKLLDACGASACVASADASPAVTPESVNLQNATPNPKSYVLGVSAPGTTTSGTFALRVVRTAYSLTPIAASCVDLSAAPDLLGPATSPVIGDDVGTPTLALPFALPFFAAPVTHYAVCMNGYAQLFPSAAGVGDCAFVNTALPDASSPNGLVAPLWDDLFPVAGQTRVRSLVTGAPPSRVFTLEWFDAAFLNGAVGPERLRFQAKLFETSGVIELHYCSLQLNGGDLAMLTGGTSTLGLENLSGSDAVQHSSDTPNSISSGSGLRFVPQ